MFKFKKKDKALDTDNKDAKDKKKSKDKKQPSESQKDADGEATPVKKSFFKRIFSLKFIIIFLLLILIIGGGGFAGWFFFLKPKDVDTGETTKTEDSAKSEEVALDKDGKPILPPEPDFPEIVDLEPFEKIRLQDGEVMNYLTIKISVELINPEMRKEIESNKDKIKKVMESEAKKMTWLVLRTPEGKLNFKYRLIGAINGAFPSSMIKNIYFTAFLLQ
ncbi:MAG: flagellar basal body-associated FliL family protein [Desulfamplus sp.]|nr:flagellar basal body-associated FliL family protein [Desulfamplus sp.]